MSACRHPVTRSIHRVLCLALLCAGGSAFASPQSASVDPVAAPCAVVETFAGEAFVLDSSRSHVDEVRESRPVSCDGWISTADAWVEIRHASGHLIRVSKYSFVQIQSGASELTLFRGVVHAQAFGDSRPFVGLTPNGRVSLRQGSGLLIYSPDRQATQWVVLDRLGKLENRFESGSEVLVREGESSILDLSRPRVLPQSPKAITVASLKPILKDLMVPEKKFKRAVRVALERQRRVFPAVIVKSTENVPERVPASAPAEIEGDYTQHVTDRETVGIEKAFRKRVLRGTDTVVARRSTSVDEAEKLESRLRRKFEAEKVSLREDLLKELGRIPASQ